MIIGRAGNNIFVRQVFLQKCFTQENAERFERRAVVFRIFRKFRQRVTTDKKSVSLFKGMLRICLYDGKPTGQNTHQHMRWDILLFFRHPARPCGTKDTLELKAEIFLTHCKPALFGPLGAAYLSAGGVLLFLVTGASGSCAHSCIAPA